MKKNIIVTKADFVLDEEIKKLYVDNAGAVVSFVGLVREQASHGKVIAIELEYYPAMTQKALEGIVEQAEQRWPLLGVIVIHRVGYLTVQEQIVLVAVASQHRHAAFAAAEFMMDYLKTHAPFWKKEYIAGQSEGIWVEAKDSDNQALAKWLKN